MVLLEKKWVLFRKSIYYKIFQTRYFIERIDSLWLAIKETLRNNCALLFNHVWVSILWSLFDVDLIVQWYLRKICSINVYIVINSSCFVNHQQCHFGLVLPHHFWLSALFFRLQSNKNAHVLLGFLPMNHVLTISFACFTHLSVLILCLHVTFLCFHVTLGRMLLSCFWRRDDIYFSNFFIVNGGTIARLILVTPEIVIITKIPNSQSPKFPNVAVHHQLTEKKNKRGEENIENLRYVVIIMIKACALLGLFYLFRKSFNN